MASKINPFADDNEIDDPFINDSYDTFEPEASLPVLSDVPMARLADPINHHPRYTFKIGEDVQDVMFAGNFLIVCHPLKVVVWNVVTNKVYSHLQHNIQGSTCCALCPEFEDPSIFIWLGLSNGFIWCVDVLGESLESERFKISMYTNMDEIHGCIVINKQSYTRSPIKRLYQHGSTIVAVDAYAILLVWRDVDVSSLNSDPLKIKLPLAIPNNVLCCMSDVDVLLIGIDFTVYSINLSLGLGSFISSEAFDSSITSMCICEYNNLNCLFIGNQLGFIHILTFSNLSALKTIHFSNYAITSLHQRPNNCFISPTIHCAVLLISLKTGDYYCCLANDFRMISVGHPTTKSEDLKVASSLIALQSLVVPSDEFEFTEFAVLSRKEQVVQVDINSTDTSSWTRRLLLKQAKTVKCQQQGINLRLVSWNIDSTKPTELIKPSSRNKKKRWSFKSKMSIQSDDEINEISQSMESNSFHEESPLLEMFKSLEFEYPDVIVVGFQEVVDLESKRVHARSLFTKKDRNQLKTPHDIERIYKDWLYSIEASIEQIYDNKYKLIKSEFMIGLFLIIFVKKDLQPNVGHVEIQSLKTGLKGYHGNKGAICARLILHDTSIAFVCAHLAAGQKNVADRNKDVKHILNNVEFSELKIPTVYMDTKGAKIWDQDMIIFFGDLNYRINITRSDCEDLIDNIDYLLALDQLTMNRLKNPSCLLRHFEECKISFKPTYKYDPYSDSFDSSDKQRIPAWCDRILYTGNMRCLRYDRLERPISSDHKAIFGEFHINCESLQLDDLINASEDYNVLEGRMKDAQHRILINRILKEFGILEEYEHEVKSVYKCLQALKLNHNV